MYKLLARYSPRFDCGVLVYLQRFCQIIDNTPAPY
ncbi:hypothetical protein VPHK120G1_0018 [Vibrio phage K120 g1]